VATTVDLTAGLSADALVELGSGRWRQPPVRPLPRHPYERRQTIMDICALTSAALLGFLAGLFSFRVKSRWCPKCGELTTTPPPPH